VNSGEYKVMGLAPHGEPRFVDTILRELIELHDDGSYLLNLDYFDYDGGLRMTNRRFEDLFGGPPRRPESPITQREKDLARSIQVVIEEALLRITRRLHELTGMSDLCLAGGVALNCVANGRLLREGPFRRIWVQPAAGDSGGAIGAALAAWHRYLQNQRTPREADGMRGALLGPSFDNDAIVRELAPLGAVLERVTETPKVAARLLTEQKVIGWFQGAMEFGPRALGSRSILADPRSPEMQELLNAKVKLRESFRPFAPTVLRERASDWFHLDCESPYMLLTAPVVPDARGRIPAVTHVDGSARVQTLRREDNPQYYDLVAAFGELTGCPVVVNTSFNVRGEPIVCRPADAYRCLMKSGLDALVIGDFVAHKSAQPPPSFDMGPRNDDELD
jgi:carbamoyltransferase